MAFPTQTYGFLKGISAHNEKAWFEAHRELYEAGYVAPARDFVSALGPRLRETAPDIQFEPKVGGSMHRVNRDIRFSKDKRPYKDHLDLWFWHGERKSWGYPGLWFSLSATQLRLGAGMYGLDKEGLETFRHSVVHPRSGKALLAAVERVAGAGYEIGGKTRKIAPRGFETDPDRAGYLLHDGLCASLTLPPEAAAQPDIVEAVAGHFAAMWPIGKWLLEEVSN